MPGFRDFLPQPPWKGPPVPLGLTNRIRSMTEHELIYALCVGEITTEQIYATFGDTPKSRSVVGEYLEYKAACETPERYWEERINRLREQIQELEEKKRKRQPPPIPYIF